jgi:RimJ/RimL family protein N-acetyltransferase
MDTSDDFPGAPLLRTRRLLLRGLRYGDINAVQALNNDTEVSRWLLEPCVKKFSEVAVMIAQANRFYQARPGLGIWHAGDDKGRFIGLYSLMPVEACDDIEIGARLRPQFWGRLYSVEGSRALCAHAFETLHLPRLVGFCDAANSAVPAIFRRLGFRCVGDTSHFGKPARRFELTRTDWRPAACVATKAAVMQ